MSTMTDSQNDNDFDNDNDIQYSIKYEEGANGVGVSIHVYNNDQLIFAVTRIIGMEGELEPTLQTVTMSLDR